MRTLKLTTLALALAGALPVQAAEPAIDVKKELQALKDKVTELEQRAKAAPAPAAAPGGAGMTAEQMQDFNRIAVKTEALEDGRDAAGLKGLKISGYADVNYVYNVNKERGTFQFLVPVGKEPYGYDNSYFGTAALDFQKETESGTRFRLTLIPMRSTGDVMGEASIVHEASASVPLGSLATKLIAGQLPDWSGYEYLPPTQNKLITHNLLFDFTLPVAYTGVGMELARGKWTIKFALANMNTSIRNVGEDVPVLVYRGDYYGGEFWGFGFAGVEGKKTNYRAIDYDGTGDPALDGKDSWADLVEVDGWYTRGDFSLFGHLAYGQQKKAAITAAADGTLRDAQWAGVSVLAAYKLTPRTEGVLRADYLYDQKNGGGLLDYTFPDGGNGIGPDPAGDPEKGADRYAVTAGLSYALNPNAVLKAEYRYDGASKAVFQKHQDGSYVKSNSLVSAAVVVSF